MSSIQGILKANKKTLRNAISSIVKSVPAASIQEQSQAIATSIFSSTFFKQCRHVSCYLSMPTGEVDTSSLVSAILLSGKTLFVPKIADGRMQFLKIYCEEDLRTLTSGIWGIKEPGEQWQGQKRLNAFDPEFEGLDLILLPGVAFDRSLSRLGHGKGYYDKFLSSYVASGHPKPLLVALALKEQVLGGGEVPMGENDWRVDMIITMDGIIDLMPSFASS